LLTAGYDVKVAANVQDGLSLLNTEVTDLLLTDGRLPDGTGIELADLADAKGTPVLILTGYAFILSELGRTKYRVLLKPMRPEEVVVAIEETLRNR
jgi:two-component system response regulator HydG